VAVQGAPARSWLDRSSPSWFALDSSMISCTRGCSCSLSGEGSSPEPKIPSASAGALPSCTCDRPIVRRHFAALTTMSTAERDHRRSISDVYKKRLAVPTAVRACVSTVQRRLGSGFETTTPAERSGGAGPADEGTCLVAQHHARHACAQSCSVRLPARPLAITRRDRGRPVRPGRDGGVASGGRRPRAALGA
jgi:hypothetical protein